MADPAKQMKQNQYAVIFMSAVLLFGAFNAVTVAGDEYDPEGYVWFNLGLDAVMTALTVILLAAILRGAEPGGLKVGAILIGLVGLAAGLVKLWVRFSSDHGWWTGHLNSSIGG